MAIPDYESLMLPLLRRLAVVEELKFADAVRQLGDDFGLTTDELKQMLPSGRDFMFRNRVGWARLHMKHADLLAQVRHGVMAITPAGRKLLQAAPARIDLATLKRFDAYRAYRLRVAVDGQGAVPAVVTPEIVGRLSPDDLIETAARELNAALVEELLATVRERSSSFFEKLVVRLLLKMGYGGSRQENGQVVGRSGDGGIDGVISEDRLGLDSIHVQAKRWQGTVGEPEIRDFLGALVGRGASKGVIITPSNFSEAARTFAARSLQQRIVLIDGERLAGLMIEHGLGVSTVATYEIKRIDSDFFSDD